MKHVIAFLVLILSVAYAYCQTNFYVTTINETGPGSITEAILNANLNPGKDSILFNIPGLPPHKIDLVNGLPAIQDAVVIDGSSQPANGFSGRSPKIIISAEQCLCGIEFSALMIEARACEIYGIFFYYIYSVVWPQGYDYGVAIYVRGDSCVIGSVEKPNYIGVTLSAIKLEADSVYITNNFIGVDTTGMIPLYNGEAISQSDTIAHSEIYILNNVIGNRITLGYPHNITTIDNHIVVKGNSIGINNDTLNPVKISYNYYDQLFFYNVQSLEIGGRNFREGNVISGIKGLYLSNCSGNIYGNRFGTNWLGTDTISNLPQSIYIASKHQLEKLIIGGRSGGDANYFGGKGTAIGLYNATDDTILIRGNHFGVMSDSLPIYLENGLVINWSQQVLMDSNIVCVEKAPLKILLGDSIKISNNFFFSDTSLTQAPFRNIIDFTTSRHCSISNNIINKTTGDGISMGGDSSVISGNIISETKNGVAILGGHKITITRNEIFDNAEKGIYIFPGANDTIQPPIFSFCTSDSVGGFTKPFGIVEIFYSLPSDASPQGKIFIGSDTADALGEWSFIAPITDSSNVTATVTDLKGNTSEFSQTITTTTFEMKDKSVIISVWPNPANDFIAISIYPLTSINNQVAVFDISGREIMKTNFSGSQSQISISSLSEGLYILEIKNDDNLSRSKLVVRR